MKAFRYDRPRTLDAAVRALGPDATLKANGIDLLDRLKERVDEPDRIVTLVDVPGLGGISREGGALVVGATATLAEVAASADVLAVAPALAEAAGSAASPQLRNRATVGGNLAQHTRCGYYRMRSFPCWKRGDAKCPVLEPGAVQETAAIFGNSSCASAHPSSLAPVLGALDATVTVRGPRGDREIGIADLYEAPKKGKPSDVTLEPSDVIVRIVVPAAAQRRRQAFVEVRQRAAFDWALVSCAVSLAADGSGTDARVWLGSVAPTPIRAVAAEKALAGPGPIGEAAAIAAGDGAVVGATPLPGSAYKVDLLRVAVKRAVLAARGRA